MQVWSATGRRKRAIAQVRICSPGTGTIKVNQVDAEQYLQGAYANILKPFETLQLDATYDIFIRAEGGGLTPIKLITSSFKTNPFLPVPLIFFKSKFDSIAIFLAAGEN